jgi:transcriptional regulator with XRE-family HTH domain
VRRSQIGLTGAELAQRAGISPSYVSLIENGAKVPDEDVAAQLARSLEDDADLYRAWVRAARLGLQNLDLLNRLDAASRTPAYLSLVESGQELPRLADADATAELSSRIREVATRLTSPSPSGSLTESSAVVSVPLLAPGTDPARLDASDAAGAILDRLLFDRRLFGTAAKGLFACDVVERDMRHLRGVAQPGDRLVFERPGRATAPDRICAVRRPAGLALSRVLASNRSLLLLPGEGESGFESLELRDDQVAADLVVASHVLLLRR